MNPEDCGVRADKGYRSVNLNATQIRTFLNTVKNLVVILDRNGDIVFFNRACEELTGYRECEVRGRNIFKLLISTGEQKGVFSVFKKLTEGDLPSFYENYWITKWGERRLISWSNTIFRGDDGEVEWIVGVGEDITDVKRTKEMLKEVMRRGRVIRDIVLTSLTSKSTTELFRTLLRETSYLVPAEVIALLITTKKRSLMRIRAIRWRDEMDLDIGDVVDIEKCRKLSGLLIGQTVIVEDLGTLSSCSEGLKKLEEAGYKAVMVIPMIADGDLIGALLLATRKWELLRESQSSLIPDLFPTIAMVVRHYILKEEYERINEELKAVNAMLKIITKTIRHNILNQTTAMRGYLELYHMKGEERYLEKLIRVIERTEDLISEMRDLEMLASRFGPLKEVDLRDSLEPFKDLYSVKIIIEGEGRVLADDGLTSVFENLINNSIIHGGCNTVRIRITPHSDRCIITVEDDGKGIPREIVERIFEEGFTYGERGGTGLGLYLVKKAVERYGGRIEVGKGELGGAAFRIQLRAA
ncbi:MAG: PAS domain S-box protein [Thermoplasmata archaeon]|nr:PAS domain S-box protein [Thermoplasmata archaeon]